MDIPYYSTSLSVAGHGGVRSNVTSSEEVTQLNTIYHNEHFEGIAVYTM